MEYAKNKDGIPICHGDKWICGMGEESIELVVGMNGALIVTWDNRRYVNWSIESLIRPITFQGLELDHGRYVYKYPGQDKYCEKCKIVKDSCDCSKAPKQPANLPEGAIAYPIVKNGSIRSIDIDEHNNRAIDIVAENGIPRLGYCYGDDWDMADCRTAWRNPRTGAFADWAVFMPDKDEQGAGA